MHEALLGRRFLARMLFYALLITIVSLVAFVLAHERSLAEARTMSFMTLALAQILHLGNARSAEAVLRPTRALANRYALGAVALAIMLQVIATSVDALATVLRLVPLGLNDWVMILLLGSGPAVVGQALKLTRPGSPEKDAVQAPS